MVNSVCYVTEYTICGLALCTVQPPCRLRLVVPGALQERGLSLAHQFDVKGQETFPLPRIFCSTLDNPFIPLRQNVLLSAERTPTYYVLLVVPVEDRRQRC